MTSEYDKPLLRATIDSSAKAPSLSLEDKHFDISSAKGKETTANSIRNATRNLLEQESGELTKKLVSRRDSLKKQGDVEVVADFLVDSHDNQSTGSDADSDGEENVVASTIDGPQIAKKYDPSIDDRLPDTVTLLRTPDGGKLYLIGTAHFSMESQDDVTNIIQAVQPHRVTVELCRARIQVLKLDEKTILQEAENITFQIVRNTMQHNGPFNGLLYILLLNMSAHLTRELGMAPGGEFRRAFTEARKVPNCVIHLGDRPIHITLHRALSSLSWWQTFKLSWHLLTTRDSISREDVERCKRQDMLEELLADLTGEYPALGEVFVRERDLYLTHSLQLACQPQSTPNGWEPSRVVGVVGIGHMRGIVENWGKVQTSEIWPIMSVPPPSLSTKIIRVTIKASLLGAVIFLGYKIIPLPSGLTLQSLKSSVEGLLKVSASR